MDHHSFMQSLRLRTSQFLTWFIGSTRTEQHYRQSDHLQRDGLIRSQQDPDTQQRQSWRHDASQTLRERFQAWGSGQGNQADAQARQQQWFEQQQRQQHERQQRGGRGYGR
jgi:hypothetical protein